jgi:hypothetical protein
MAGTPAKRSRQRRLAITVNEIGLFLCTRVDPTRGLKAFLASPPDLGDSQQLLHEAIEGLKSEVTATFFAPHVAAEIAFLQQVSNEQLLFVERAFQCGQKLAFLRLIAGKVHYAIHRDNRIKRSQSEAGKISKLKSDAQWKRINKRFLEELRKKPKRTKDEICRDLSREFKLEAETLKGRLRLPENGKRPKSNRSSRRK